MTAREIDIYFLFLPSFTVMFLADRSCISDDIAVKLYKITKAFSVRSCHCLCQHTYIHTYIHTHTHTHTHTYIHTYIHIYIHTC